MVESNIIRKPVLAGRSAEGSSIAMTVAEPATRFILRLDPASALAVGSAGGFDVSGPINSVRGTDGKLAVRLGPNEWFLIAEDGEGQALEAAIAASLGDRFHALVDVSHRNTAVVLSGENVVDVLNAGCPIDLSDAAFAPGSATRTILGKSEIVLIRPESGDGWRVECWRSFAPYVFEFLTEASR